MLHSQQRVCKAEALVGEAISPLLSISLRKDRACVIINHPSRREESHRLGFLVANRAPVLYQPVTPLDLLVICILPCAVPALSDILNSQ